MKNNNIRNILDERQAREWFEVFGYDIGQTFDQVFGDMDLSKQSSTFKLMFKVIDGIMFIKMKTVMEEYAIIPHLNTYV